jgi:hypothetical protein
MAAALGRQSSACQRHRQPQRRERPRGGQRLNRALSGALAAPRSPPDPSGLQTWCHAPTPPPTLPPRRTRRRAAALHPPQHPGLQVRSAQPVCDHRAAAALQTRLTCRSRCRGHRLPASLVTEDPEVPGSTTMNIVTYACPVSIKPERHYALGARRMAGGRAGGRRQGAGAGAAAAELPLLARSPRAQWAAVIRLPARPAHPSHPRPRPRRCRSRPVRGHAQPRQHDQDAQGRAAGARRPGAGRAPTSPHARAGPAPAAQAA